MAGRAVQWIPASVIGVGILFAVGLEAQRATPLNRPLVDAVPMTISGYNGREVELDERMQRGINADAYVLRLYSEEGESSWGVGPVRVYIAYYANQYRGKTIHSPKNCLPGAGWEAVDAELVPVVAGASTVWVNRYLLQKDDERALVLYWYQGRGRVEANEYKVKWDLLWDAALSRRSEEALVQVVAPVRGSEAEALRVAAGFAGELISVMDGVLPGRS